MSVPAHTKPWAWFRSLVIKIGFHRILLILIDTKIHFKTREFNHSGLCSSQNQITSSLVLAGDPKQLDAVTRSRCATKLGFNVSFMEQLLKRPLYKRNSKTGEYNHNYITQLVKNYRSHSAILHAANTLFYENKLQVSAAKGSSWHFQFGLFSLYSHISVICYIYRNDGLVHWIKFTAIQKLSGHISVGSRICQQVEQR